MVASKDKLVGKKIVVVGGTSGIGHGAALALLEHGAHVTIISSSADRVKQVLADISHDHLKGEVGNVRDEAQFTEVLRSLAPIDHLIFSGVDKIIRGPIADADFEEQKNLFGVKFWGSALCGKAAAKYDIISPGGSLTLTSGTGAMSPGKTASIGGALNAGLFTMTQGLALELAEKKIRVNCVVPGMVATELWDKVRLVPNAATRSYSAFVRRMKSKLTWLSRWVERNANRRSSSRPQGKRYLLAFVRPRSI
jgi:NAD(P)-dependent dehydrogenase (short-subunit alcohol dehydrogenase family)